MLVAALSRAPHRTAVFGFYAGPTMLVELGLSALPRAVANSTIITYTAPLLTAAAYAGIFKAWRATKTS